MRGRVAPTALYYLLYVSKVARAMDDDELVDILTESRRNNERDDITGLLLYKEDTFMQLLEGPHQAVSNTFDRIERDPRHTKISVLVEGSVDARRFARWSMGFSEMSRLHPQNEEERQALESALTFQPLSLGGRATDRGIMLLQMFQRDLTPE